MAIVKVGANIKLAGHFGLVEPPKAEPRASFLKRFLDWLRRK